MQSNRELSNSDIPAEEHARPEGRGAAAARLPWRRPELKALAIGETQTNNYPGVDGFDIDFTAS